MLKINIQENINISQNSELTEQDSAKKSEKEFIFPSESQKFESNLNDKQDNKKNVFKRSGEDDKAKVINISKSEEQLEYLVDNKQEASFLDELTNKNIDYSISDEEAIGESDEKEASNISSNRRNLNIPYTEAPYQENSTNYIVIGIKDT